MKYAGMLLVVVMGIGLGRLYAARLYRRHRLLQQTDRLLAALLQRLMTTARPLAVLWRQMAADGCVETMPLLQVTAASLAQEPFDRAFAAGVESMTAAGLQPADRQLLLEFGRGCGRSGLSAQVAHIRTYRQLLAEQAQQAGREAATKGPVYQMLGLAAGVALAFLLL